MFQNSKNLPKFSITFLLLLILVLLEVLLNCYIEAATIPEEYHLNELNNDDTWTLDGGRIVGGHKTSITKHPHQITLRRRSCTQCAYEHLCGGSIYSKDVIITAAHCIIDSNVGNYMVVAGTDNRRGNDGSIVRIKEIVVHQGYDQQTNDKDIALLFLASPLPLNNYSMAAIPLATKVPSSGVKAVVTGWGALSEGGNPSSKLMEVEVPIVNHQLCAESYLPSQITDNMICGGFMGLGGKDSCQGDSGGPFVVNRQLAGVVSFGKGCARPDKPGVYTNVFAMTDWILNTIKEKEGQEGNAK